MKIFENTVTGNYSLEVFMCHEQQNIEDKLNKIKKPVIYAFAAVTIFEPIEITDKKSDMTNHSIYIQPHSLEPEMKFENSNQNYMYVITSGTYIPHLIQFGSLN
jgi:hypothetical protein